MQKSQNHWWLKTRLMLCTAERENKKAKAFSYSLYTDFHRVLISHSHIPTIFCVFNLSFSQKLQNSAVTWHVFKFCVNDYLLHATKYHKILQKYFANWQSLLKLMQDIKPSDRNYCSCEPQLPLNESANIAY